MKRPPLQPKTYLSAVGALIFLLGAWIAFFPAEFGGRAVYLIISGVSMEPTFYTGDLAILHRTDDYRIGDIAAYYHPLADGIIIHRIIGVEDGRYVLLGDNKPDIDPYRPTPDDMVGRYWFHLPGVGHLIDYPKFLGLLSPPVVILFLIIALAPSLIVGKSRQKKKIGVRATEQRQVQMNQPTSLQANKTDLIFFLTVLAIASAILAIFAFNQPLSTSTTEELSYEQQGDFSYTAIAPPGIYNADLLETGAPIFRELINQVTVDFDYRFAADLPAEVTGAHRLLAELSHANGWRWTVELAPETVFSGPAFSLSRDLDLAEIQSLIDNLEQQTGLQGQQYRLTVIPEVSVSGTLNGHPFRDQFAPRLEFDFDQTQMQLARRGTSRLDAAQPDPLAPTQPGAVTRPVQRPTVLSLLGLNLTVSTIRQIAVAGLVISMAGWLVLGWLLLRPQPEDEIANIRATYGSRLINIQDGSLTVGRETVEVSTIDDLGQLVEQTGGVIMHYASGDQYQYLVKVDSLIYRYRTRRRPVVSPQPAPEQAQ